MFEREGRGPGSNQESDMDLYRAAGRGSEDAMAALYRRHGSLVYRFSLRMCQDAWAAEEVTQEVFLALLRQPDRSIRSAQRCRRGCAALHGGRFGSTWSGAGGRWGLM